MSIVIASPRASVAAFQIREAAGHPRHHDHPARTAAPKPSRIWVLLEALAYAGAAIDPAAALAARRFARVRDEELQGHH